MLNHVLDHEFQVKFWKSRIPGKRRLIDMERKRCASIKFVTLNFDLTITMTPHERHIVSDRGPFDCLFKTLTMDFKSQILKKVYLKNGRVDKFGTKGVRID